MLVYLTKWRGSIFDN